MEIPYEVTPRRDTGLFNSKLGIWLFLASEVMLFGGLFSAYVFLRVGVIEGVDTPWPWGINVHKTFVALGFVNTLVLIISSVFVVFGWIALKERKWAKFQIFMYLTVACAAVFMMLKTVEYRSKLTQHHDIKLKDNSLLEGKILDRSFDVPFEAERVEFNLTGSSPGFIKDVVGDFPKGVVTWNSWEAVLPEGSSSFTLKSAKEVESGAVVSGDGIAKDTTVKDFDAESGLLTVSAPTSGRIADGSKVTVGEKSFRIVAVPVQVDLTEQINSAAGFKSWFVRARTKSTTDLVVERRRYRREIARKEDALYNQGEVVEPTGPQIDTKAVFVADEPFQLHSRRRQVRPITRGEEKDSMTYIDGCTIYGKGGDDRIKFEPHYVDMQLVPVHKQESSLVWSVLGDSHLKDSWYKNRNKAYVEMEHYYSGKDKEIPEGMLRGYYINIQSIHDNEEKDPFWTEFFREFKAGAGIGGGAHGDDHAHDDHGEGHDDQVKIEAQDDSHGDHAKAGDTHGKGEAHGDTHEGHAEDHHGDHGHAVVMIPRDQVKFMNSHGPRNSNYYAIYFTMTALHGLHVIGGALVLLYFVVFGKPLYLKNPEHLANRVEVGGLFWHFVDLVWIFLFPLMYLL